MTLDTLGSLMFLAGFLAAIGLGPLVLAGHEYIQMVRYRRHRRRPPFADFRPDITGHNESTHGKILDHRP